MGALRNVLRTAPSDVVRDALGMCSGCIRNASRNACTRGVLRNV